MRFVKTVTVSTEILSVIECDCCHTAYDIEADRMEIQEFFSFSMTAGYGSVFGDMNKVSIDLCQHCAQKLLGDYIQVDKF